MHLLAFLLHGRAPLCAGAIFNTALFQHVGQHHLVVVDLFDGPFVTLEGILGGRRRHDHVDFAIIARPEFRDFDRFEQWPRIPTEPGKIPAATRSGRQEQTGCQKEDGLQGSTARGKHGLRKIP